MGFTKGFMEDILDHSIPSLIERNSEGLLGVECASSYWGMSTFPPYIPIFLVNDEFQDNNGFMVEFYIQKFFVPSVNYDNVVQLAENLYITDREQTVCDMLRYNRHEFHLYETIMSAYEDGKVDIEKLEELAQSYSILEKLRETYKQACICYNEDNE